jgi:hypothetical protein
MVTAARPGPRRIRSTFQRKSPQELAFEREHPAGVGLQRALAAVEDRGVPRVMKVLQLATEISIVKIGR